MKSRKEIPLVGSNYEWYDGRKGVAKLRNKRLTIGPTSDRSPRVNWGMWFKDKRTQIRWYTDPTFRPKNNILRYRKLQNPEKYINNRSEKLSRASYIPYIKDEEGEKYWLLGSFHDFPEIKVDFGGQCERFETALDCATRELGEETHQILTPDIISIIVGDGKYDVYRGYNTSGVVKIFIMLDITDRLDDLDEVQRRIDIATPADEREKFGPLGFYQERELFKGLDHKNNTKIYTSLALTDFIRNYKWGL